MVFKVFEGVFEIFYKEDEEPIFPPQIRRPYYCNEFCSSCGKGYYKADRCPECGTARRKNGDNPRVSLNFEDLES